MRRPIAIAATLVALTGCGGTAGAVLRVRPPAPTADEAADAQRSQMEEVVREVAAARGLSCRPSIDRGDEILGCWPAATGASPAFLSLHLLAAADSYRVLTLESFGGFAGPKHLCPLQDRLAERVQSRLPGAVVERDARLTCPRKP